MAVILLVGYVFFFLIDYISILCFFFKSQVLSLFNVTRRENASVSRVSSVRNATAVMPITTTTVSKGVSHVAVTQAAHSTTHHLAIQKRASACVRNMLRANSVKNASQVSSNWIRTTYSVVPSKVKVLAVAQSN